MSGSSVASLLLPSGPGSSIGAQLECDRFFLFLDQSAGRRYACSSIGAQLVGLGEKGLREEQKPLKLAFFTCSSVFLVSFDIIRIFDGYG